ncbi:MAG: ribosome assembly factor SBDS [archaeon]
MISIDKAVIAKIDSHGEHFEVFVDPDAAQKFRETGAYEDVLAADEVFFDARKGEKSSTSKLTTAFGTTDHNEIVKVILKKGELHLTTEQKKRMSEVKRKKAIDLIVRNAINPQANTPYTPQRIEILFEEARISIDPFKKVEDQVADILNKLKPLAPIKFESITLAIKIPAAYTGKAYAHVKKHKPEREDWLSDGSYSAVITIPAGIQDDLFRELNAVCKGELESQILQRL